MREVGVFDGPDADLRGDRAVEPALLDDLVGAALRLGEELIKLDEIPLPRRDGAALVSHEAKGNVDELDVLVPHEPRNREPLREVEFLPRVRHVDDPLRVILLLAAFDARQVARRVVVAAVGFADDGDAEVLLLQVDDERTLGLDGKPHLLKAFDDAGHLVVVERLAAIRVEGNAEFLVDALELADGNVDELPPEREVLFLALLEEDELALAVLLPHAVRLLGLRRREDVALLQRGDGEVVALLLREQLAVALDEDAELRPPVAEVVVGDDRVAEREEEAFDRVADDGRADVADVHLLGRVGRGVVDDDLPPRADLRDTEMRRLVERTQPRREPAVRDGEVEEPGPRHIDFLERLAAFEFLGDFHARLTRVEAHRLREPQRLVALVVAELRVARGHDAQLGSVPLREHAAARLFDKCRQIHSHLSADSARGSRLFSSVPAACARRSP